jgi:hypothetical protein
LIRRNEKTFESAHYIDEMQSNMNAIGRSRIFQSAIVLLVIFSWIAISNHCAFGAVAARADVSPAACPFHSKPAKQKEQPTEVQCCRILRAVVSTAAKSWVRDHSSFSDVDLYFEKLALIATSRNASLPLLLDTGPPGARSFAELILQRSILAHAPPFLA